jgi:GNAT superfamily N-acetyltransferase
MRFEVRPAREDEVDGIMAMYPWLFDGPGREPPGWNEMWARQTIGDAIASDRSAVLVAGLLPDPASSSTRTELIGLCTGYLDLDSVRFGTRCWVEDLAVHPERRSEGVGQALLDAMRSWAAGRGATHLELDTGIDRSDAQRFYDRQGEAHKGISYSWPL